MNKYISQIPQYQQLLVAFLAVTAVSFGAGYQASNSQQIIDTPVIESFDPFEYKATNEVEPLIQKTVDNPTEYNLMVANNALKISIYNWADRHTGENKALFMEYLDACEAVINSMQDGESIDETNAKIIEMNKLKNELN